MLSTLLFYLIIARLMSMVLGIVLRDEGDTYREIEWESRSKGRHHSDWLHSKERKGSQAPL